MTNALQSINRARQALAEARDLYEILNIRDKAKAVAVLAEAQGAGEAANEAKEIQLRAERKAGEFLKNVPRRQGQRTDITSSHDGTKLYTEVLEDVKVPQRTAHRWQKTAEIPDDKFEQFIHEKKAKGEELTAKAVYHLATHKPHVSNNSGNNEWYTPPEYIEAARAVMGSIDLDPASSHKANEIVQAETYYTIEDNGLEKEWFGNVWMNPPYSQPEIKYFSYKLANEYTNIGEACVLVNNATETGWYQRLLDHASAVCLITGRVKFIDIEGNRTGAPLQGQTVIYYGSRPQVFALHFKQFGKVLYVR